MTSMSLLQPVEMNMYVFKMYSIVLYRLEEIHERSGDKMVPALHILFTVQVVQ
jgi:hypothetical protein